MTYAKFFAFLVCTYVLGGVLTDLSYDLWLYAIATLPGTFLHECMHYIAAMLLNGQPRDFTIVPDGNTLGSVMFAGNWYNRATVAMAPLLLAPLTFWFVALASRSFNPLKIFLLLWIAASSWVACIPSGQDFSIALRYPSSWPLAVIILGLTTFITFKIVKRTLNKV